MFGVGLLLGVGLGCSSCNRCNHQQKRCQSYNCRYVEYREYSQSCSSQNRCGSRCNCGCRHGHHNYGCRY